MNKLPTGFGQVMSTDVINQTVKKVEARWEHKHIPMSVMRNLLKTLEFYHDSSMDFAKRVVELNDLLNDLLPALMNVSCKYAHNRNADKTFHCCDANELVERIAKTLGVEYKLNE